MCAVTTVGTGGELQVGTHVRMVRYLYTSNHTVLGDDGIFDYLALHPLHVRATPTPSTKLRANVIQTQILTNQKQSGRCLREFGRPPRRTLTNRPAAHPWCPYRMPCEEGATSSSAMSDTNKPSRRAAVASISDVVRRRSRPPRQRGNF